MKLGEIVEHMGYYNFTKFHQNQMKNKKVFIDSPFFCSEFQSVGRIVKIVQSAHWCVIIILSIISSRNLCTIQRKIHYPYKSNLFRHRHWPVIGYILHVPGHLGVGPLQRQMLPSFYLQVLPSSHKTWGW